MQLLKRDLGVFGCLVCVFRRFGCIFRCVVFSSFGISFSCLSFFNRFDSGNSGIDIVVFIVNILNATSDSNTCFQLGFGFPRQFQPTRVHRYS